MEAESLAAEQQSPPSRHIRVELSSYPGWIRFLHDLAVDEVNAIKLYGVFWVRIAWRSTWINQYREGCLHSTLESAIDFAETCRVQGSQFRIEELPALALCTSKGVVCVTQFNVVDPFSTFTVSTDAPETSLRVGQPLQDAMKVFTKKSASWRLPPTAEKSAIFAAALGRTSARYLEQMAGARVAIRRAINIGSTHKLLWSPAESHRLCNGARRIENEVRSSSLVRSNDS
jgi:hypothetical protein